MPPERDYHRPVMTLQVLLQSIGDPPPSVRRALRSKLLRVTDLQSANGWGFYRLGADDRIEKTPLGHAATAFFADEDALLAWHVATAEEAMRDLTAYVHKQLAQAPLGLVMHPGARSSVRGRARRLRAETRSRAGYKDVQGKNGIFG